MKIIFQNLVDFEWADLAKWPNLISLSGIFLISCLNLLLCLGQPINSPWIFIIVIGILLSDLLDGPVARYLQMVTPLGDFLDKARDKYFIISIFAHFIRGLWHYGNEEVRLMLIVILIVEFFLVGIWIIGSIKRLNLDTHWTGKIKTDVYFGTIGLWFFLELRRNSLSPDLVNFLYKSLPSLLCIGLFFGIVSVLIYLQRYNSSQNN